MPSINLIVLLIVILPSSKEIRITTELGTDIRTSVTEVHGATPGLYTEKGLWGNLPTGEVDSGVKNTNGKLIVDASFGGLGKINSPLTLTIKDNKVESIEGERADELKEMLDKVGKDAYKMAELGIGTNEKAIVTGNILEDEKVKGTIHMAVGNDMSYGGENNVPIHLDGVISKPTIYIDDKMIMKNREFLL